MIVYLLPLLLFICWFSILLSFKTPNSNYFKTIKYQYVSCNTRKNIKNTHNTHSYQTELNEVIDSDISNISEISNGFLSSFTSHSLGQLLGSICFALILRYTTDFIWNSIQSTMNPASITYDAEVINVDVNKNSSKDANIPLDAWFMLLLCIAVDLAGDASFILPGIGEVEDTIWAPISSFIISKMYGSNILTFIDFSKEILPFTDGLPVAIIAWIIKYKYPTSPAAKLLGLNDKSN